MMVESSYSKAGRCFIFIKKVLYYDSKTLGKAKHHRPKHPNTLRNITLHVVKVFFCVFDFVCDIEVRHNFDVFGLHMLPYYTIEISLFNAI